MPKKDRQPGRNRPAGRKNRCGLNDFDEFPRRSPRPAALAGLLGPPMILIIAVGALYAHYGDLPALRRMLTGIAAAAAGLMLATVAKMARPLFKGSFKSWP